MTATVMYIAAKRKNHVSNSLQVIDLRIAKYRITK